MILSIGGSMVPWFHKLCMDVGQGQGSNRVDNTFCDLHSIWYHGPQRIISKRIGCIASLVSLTVSIWNHRSYSVQGGGFSWYAIFDNSQHSEAISHLENIHCQNINTWKKGKKKNEQTCSLQLSDSVCLWTCCIWQSSVSLAGSLNNCQTIIQDSHAQTLLGFIPGNSGTRHTTHETRHTPGPPSQDLTSGWKQPESDNNRFQKSPQMGASHCYHVTRKHFD